MKEITLAELKAMRGAEGIILRGCGGDLMEWENGITEMFKESGIIGENASFKDVSHFTHEGLSCVLFPFEDIEIDMGKLAFWRLNSRPDFGGIWLSDYLDNKFGIYSKESEQEKPKPDCPLIGADDNIFNLIGIAGRTLRRNKMRDEAKEMQERVMSSGSYEEALSIIGEYVNITSEEEMNEGSEMGLA